MNANPKGRVDVLALSVVERIILSRAANGSPIPAIWDALKPAAEQAIKAGMKAAGVPRKNLLATGFGAALESALGRTRASGGCA